MSLCVKRNEFGPVWVICFELTAWCRLVRATLMSIYTVVQISDYVFTLAHQVDVLPLA